MPQKFKPQFRRLLAIDNALRKGGKVNCGTLLRLPELEELSAKTVMRDIDYMKLELGAPIEYDGRRKSYYYTNSRYSLTGVPLTEGDLFAITIAEKVLAQYKGTQFHDDLKKAFDKICEKLPEYVTVAPGALSGRYAFFSPALSGFKPRIWEALSRGLAEERVVRISHTVPGFDKPVEREVDPYHLVNHDGSWYLIGWCHYKVGIRTFALSRMDSADVLDAGFEIPQEFDLKEYMGSHFGIIRGQKDRKVRLLFESKLRQLIVERQWHPSQKVSLRRDGGVVLEMMVNDLVEIKRWVLSWGGGVEVLAPKELRDRVREDARAAAQRNRRLIRPRKA